MKVRKECYLRSPLLRPPYLKKYSDPNQQCEPWYSTVPSITYIWTHRPQWRRRHQNRKKATTQRFPLTFINLGGNKDDLWKTLNYRERPWSRSSNSPYETCSSRQIVVESELMQNFGGQRNREVYGLTFNKRNDSFDRKGLACETRSKSKLQISKGTKLLRSIRSQKRLSVRNSVNSQNTVGTPSSLEIKRSVQLSVWKGFQSDCNIPKRRVTFSNYVSKNSVTETKSQINAIIMNDSDTSEASWWQGSYIRFTDDEDNCSMETDLSCLISSMIFDESTSSFFSLTSAKSLEIEKHSKTTLNRKFSESFLYVNSSYSNGSSCNLLSLSNNFSNDHFEESNRSFLFQKNCNNDDDFIKKKLSKSSSSNDIVADIKMSEKIKPEPTYSHAARNVDFIKKQLWVNLKESNDIIPDFKIPEEIKTEPTYDRTPRILDIMNNKSKNKLSESNQIVSDIKISKKMKIQPTYSHTPCIVDVMKNKLRYKVNESNENVPDNKIYEEINIEPTCSSIELITIELKDISSTVEEISIESQEESNKEERYEPISTNHISTDTSGLPVLNLIPSLDPMTELLKNDVDSNGRLSVNDIFDFFKQPLDPRTIGPTESFDASFLLKKFTKVGGKTFRNYDTINEFGNIGRKTSKENIKVIKDQVELLRIDTETCGQYETVLIEMKYFGNDLENNEIFKSKSLQTSNRLNRTNKISEVVQSSTSNFHSEYAKCSTGNKCCLICGRKTMDNSRYIRPVCRVKGETSSPRLENDPWINVMKKVNKYNNRKELIPQVSRKPKNKESIKDEKLTEKSMKNSVSNVYKNTKNEMPTHIEKESEIIDKKKQVEEEEEEEEEERLSVIITEAKDPSPSIPSVEMNILLSRADQSTSSCPPELSSSTSFGFATFRGLRTQSAKTYFMRESVRTVEGTANRLLCVISESDSLMAVPPFLPKKAPDWFGRQMPTRRWLRR